MRYPTLIIGFILVLYSMQSNAQVSKNVHQLIALEDDKRELRTLNIHVHGADVEIVKIRGTRVQAKTKISISLNNLPFLDYLTKNERYKLESIPNDGQSTANIEAKLNKELVIRGEICTEDMSYVFYVPDYIENVRIHNMDSDF